MVLWPAVRASIVYRLSVAAWGTRTAFRLCVYLQLHEHVALRYFRKYRCCTVSDRPRTVSRAPRPLAIPKCLSAARHGTVSSQHTYDHNDSLSKRISRRCARLSAGVALRLCLPRCTWLLLLLLLPVRPRDAAQSQHSRRSASAFFFLLFFLSSPHAMAPLSRPPLAAPTVFLCVWRWMG